MSVRQPVAWSVAPVLGANDVRAAARYYEDKLGFHCDPETGIYGGIGDEGAVYAILDRDGIVVHLQIRRREINARRQRIENDAYFFVPDADALHEELAVRGATILRPPADAPGYGLRDFLVADLDGNRLMFGSAKD